MSQWQVTFAFWNGLIENGLLKEIWSKRENTHAINLLVVEN